MADRAVFMDRDHTLIEDPGYINDPALVKLLPGVDLALKWLAQAGWRLIVVTNQSGVARGLISEAQLEQVHRELRRQLQEKGAKLDAIYYCPYHPQGSVERYAVESGLRKPQPGMLLQGAQQLKLDLRQCWMVGDGTRDIEAGQRAGCRTIRLRTGSEQDKEELPPVQADFTVRNLVEAAKVILQQDRIQPPGQPPHVQPPHVQPPHTLPTQGGPTQVQPAQTKPTQGEPASAISSAVQLASATNDGSQPQQAASEAKASAPPRTPEPKLDEQQFRKELLGYARQIARAGYEQDFNLPKLLGGIVQVLTLGGLIMVLWNLVEQRATVGTLAWAIVTLTGQVLALTLLMLSRR